jgi:cysteine desulfurase family protein (TIGR01976 family)
MSGVDWPIDEVRSMFPALDREVAGQRVVYLDGPGGSQMPEVVIAALANYWRQGSANTHGAFATSQLTDSLILGARTAAADFLHAPAGATISFGANMTTLSFALAWAMTGVLRPGDEVLLTDLDHDGNVAPWLRVAEDNGYRIKWAPMVPEGGTLDMDGLLEAITPATKVVAVVGASNATGSITPLAPIRARTREVGARMVVDAVHWAPHLPIDCEALDPDFLLCSAYKFFGPHGVGILYAAPGAFRGLRPAHVRPQSDEAPECIETGTKNHEGLAALVAAIDFIASWAPSSEGSRRARLTAAMERIAAYEAALFEELWNGLGEVPGVRRLGRAPDGGPRAPTVSFTVNSITTPQVGRALGDRGIFASAGTFYAHNWDLRLEAEGGTGAVRFGLAPYNTLAEVHRVLSALSDIVRAD